MEHKTLSVIIPAYNVERYIEKCIDSIKNQIDNTMEIIIVDDGSSDSTATICDMYAEENKNIRVFHINNGGQARARNIGIGEAKGEYIMFIDSDDYICDNEFIRKVRSKMNERPDIIIYGYKKYWEGINLYTDKQLLNFNKLRNNNVLEYMIEKNYFKGCPWDKIVKTSIIKENNLVFPEGRLSEDIDWCAQLIKNINTEKISVINENPYVYVQHEGTTSKLVKEKHISDIMYIFEKNISQNSDEILLDYFAYEYSMSLGVLKSRYCENISKDMEKKFYSYKWILKYRTCKKVKFCYIFCKIIGIRCTAAVLGMYVNLKKKGI